MKLRALALVGLLFSCGLSVMACSADTEEPAIGEGEDDITKALVITDADNGKTFSVPKGKDVRVLLGANATTGYKWKVAATSRSLGYPSPKEGDYQGPGAGAGIGAAGKHLFLWKTNSPLLRPSGTAHTVKLEYRRPFESDETPAERTFTFKLKIKEGAVLPPPDADAPVVLKEADDGGTVTAKEGQDVVVKLKANASAGYRWHVESTNRTWGYPQSDYETTGPAGAVGAPGISILTWKTDGPLSKVGTHRVTLKYSRGEAGRAEKTFSFSVKVTPASTETEFACPPESRKTINCMPIVSPSVAKYCAGDYRSWAEANCDVSYLD
ncbi:MAG: protease inhibitor I42 family protein [Deltaproteobacteria bacterium]|nr:protease inhibitor I42 family protein [Deltaproteobacteria bacterium]